jgi:hypothetical protein
MTTPPVALTIAGSDPSGGAGLQADLKTFHQHGAYGTSVITLITVQNTRAVSAVEILRPALVVAQLEAVLSDIPPAAAKTGALGDAAVIAAVAARLRGTTFPLVVDPVMVSKHGAALIADDAVRTLVSDLLPRATLVTPNLAEAERLAGFPVADVAAMERADADFFADLAAVVDEACVRQQAQYRARELARAAAGGAGSSIGFGMVGGTGSGPFVDPESVIRAAVVDGALDAAAAATLREYVAAQGHEPILAALRSQVEVTLTKGRELALLEADLFQPPADGEQGASFTVNAEAGQRMQAAGEAMAAARGESSARARQVLDALPALLKEPQRPGFLRAADVVRYPETFKDPTDMEPMFAKALALAELDTATMSAITTQRSEYRTAYAALRDQLTQVRPKAVMPEFSGSEEGGIEDFQARMNASQAAGRQLKQLKTDRDELNRRTMRQLQTALGEERAKAIGELPAQRKGRGLSIPGLEGVQITVP